MMNLTCTTDHKEFMIQTLTDLGWKINFDKSELEPGKCCKFIGFNVHSKRPQGPWLQVLAKKLHALKRDIRIVLNKGTVSARFLAKIGGQCVAMMCAILPAKLLHNLYHNISFRDNWESPITIDQHCIQDLHW